MGSTSNRLILKKYLYVVVDFFQQLHIVYGGSFKMIRCGISTYAYIKDTSYGALLCNQEERRESFI